MKDQKRQRVLSVLAKSVYQDIAKYWKGLNITPHYQCLKKPELGMAMVRAQAGGGGDPFNMGEMTITRCVVQLDNENLGFAYIAGRDFKKAELVALIDACYQDEIYQDAIELSLIQLLEDKIHQQLTEHQQQVENTKVDFFTMVRGE